MSLELDACDVCAADDHIHGSNFHRHLIAACSTSWPKDYCIVENLSTRYYYSRIMDHGCHKQGPTVLALMQISTALASRSYTRRRQESKIWAC
ncbi:hypothetical protein K466DRAFT_338721 [Polyporus arcularius HHB13444]|uniref:Uncharacterized protein n=1 Tax=Polyporus arcularius HHB13444 TaxID=1314778 RepID=A0A5C3PND3_9APHY|nr:hypothetical protein K466DRAFT_338721 [Polyporus arcularius HHB13444]